MKGVLLAGGTGSRLLPLTKVINKHLLPVHNKPMIYYPIETLRESGITDILVILGGNSVGAMVELLGDGGALGVSITYRYQYKANGIAGALKLARDFVGQEPFVVILGDNVFENAFPNLEEGFKELQNIESDQPTAIVFLSPTDRPSSFGVPTFKADGTISKITEKPVIPDSNFAVTGLYVYDSSIWEFIDNLELSDRGEFEITDCNNWYIDNGTLAGVQVEGYWRDAGDIDALHEVSLLASGLKEFMSGVYQIRNTSTKKVYVGSSSNLFSRRGSHFNSLRKNKHGNIHLQNAWNKYGEENFVFEILELCNASQLLEKEKKWFELTSCCSSDFGYNICKVPGRAPAPQKFGKENPFYGKKHTQEVKNLISKLSKGPSNGNAKLNQIQIEEIKLLIQGRTLKYPLIAKKYGVSRRTIESISYKMKRGLI